MTRPQITGIIPFLAGRRRLVRACASILLFALAAFAGEWVVHQLEYLIEYRQRFGAIMATTPHHYYMGPLGFAFAMIAIGLISVAALLLRIDGAKRRRLLHLLPSRLHRFIPDPTARVSFYLIGRTALLLAGYQMVIYLVQENLEATAEGSGLPGLAVLIAPEHRTVILLHLLIALCGSLLLWTLAALLRGSRQATEVVEALTRLFAPSAAVVPQQPIPLRRHIPNQQLLAGARSLRSPPLAA